MPAWYGQLNVNHVHKHDLKKALKSLVKKKLFATFTLSKTHWYMNGLLCILGKTVRILKFKKLTFVCWTFQD